MPILTLHLPHSRNLLHFPSAAACLRVGQFCYFQVWSLSFPRKCFWTRIISGQHFPFTSQSGWLASASHPLLCKYWLFFSSSLCETGINVCNMCFILKDISLWFTYKRIESLRIHGVVLHGEQILISSCFFHWKITLVKHQGYEILAFSVIKDALNVLSYNNFERKFTPDSNFLFSSM